MADQRLPQKDELVTPNDDLLIHVVDPNDISHYPTGTSKKMSRADFLGTQFAQLFTSLLDAPNTYTGNGLKTVQVNAAENALVFEFAEFLQLNDVTETTFTTKQGQIVKVNATANGLEFGINNFINLADVSETTLEYQQGKAVVVDVDLGTEPATYSLKFQNFPTFEDIYGGNAIINGGITYLGTGLNYNIWANRYIINGRYFDTAVRGDVTNNAGDASYDRFDVYFIEIDNQEPPNISVGILEGTAALNPIIPTLDLSTQVQVSVALIKANATTDPNAITEEIFNDNTGEPTEWTNITLPTGADLASLVDPKVGASSALFPAYAIPSTVSWQNDVQWTYVANEELLFYIKPATAFVAQATLQFQLINSVSLDYWNLTLRPSDLINYGYDVNVTGWQLIQIGLSSFVSSSRTETQYDTLKLTLNRTPQLGVDWLVLQGGVANPSVPNALLLAVGQVLGILTTTQIINQIPIPLKIYRNTGLLQSNVSITQTGTTRFTSAMTPSTNGASGYYRVSFSIAIASTDHDVFTFDFRINGLSTGILGIIDLTNNTITEGTTSFTAITPNAIYNGDNVEIYVYSQGISATFTCESAVFNIERIGVL
tara:strand:+ start:3199 stop:4998 length:1800 start_codon:yes stop_codon:yes gene_type:complete